MYAYSCKKRIEKNCAKISKINNKPLIEYTPDKKFSFKNIFVSTNDKKIIEISKKYNIAYQKIIVCVHDTSSESILHATKTINKNRKKTYRFIEVCAPRIVLILSSVFLNTKIKSKIFSAYSAKKYRRR